MTRLTVCSLVLTAVAVGACHHPPPPAAAPTPTAAPVRTATPAPPAPPTDDGSAARARADAERRAREAADAARASVGARIYFDYDRDELLPEATAILDSKVPILRTNAALHIRIEGNADDRGSDEYNLALGQRRAAQARRYLVSRGIAESRIDVTSFGEEHPVCRDDVESCWHQNRRDEFVITAGGDQISAPRS